MTPTAGVAGATGASEAWQGVNVEDMAGDWSTPEPERRNLFRFGQRKLTPPPVGPGAGSTPVAPVRDRDLPDLDSVLVPRGATAPRGTVDIPLTFIGFVESPGIEGRVVVLTDGELVFHGRVGDVIDGRYRIVETGLESVEVERVDGRGQQTLRLSSGSSGGL